MGETAPVLVLVGYARAINFDPFNGNQASLPLLIYTELGTNPSAAGQLRMWGGALTLIIIVMVFQLLASLISRFSAHLRSKDHPVAKRIDLKDLDIYYGKFHAVQNVNLTVPPRTVTAFIGPSGCGKSTVLRTLNRMHEVIPGARVEGEVLLDGENIYARGSTRSPCAARSAWCSSARTRSRRCRSATTSSPA